MESNPVIYPPNRPLERVMEPSKVPVLYEYLLFMDANTKGELLVGCSNVAGSYWEGTLFHYNSFEKAKENAYNKYFISNSTTTDGIFLDDHSILLAEDNGCLTILNTQQNAGRLLICQTIYTKAHPITKVASWGSSKAVACYDSSISLYNLDGDTIIQQASYDNYHTDIVKSVDTNKYHEDLFASCSMDRKSCMWDVRMENPTQVLYTNEFCPFTSVAWNKKRENELVIGSGAGDIYLIDIRKPNEFVSVNHCFDSSVYKLAFSDSGNLAVCGDVPNLLMYRCHQDGFEKILESSDHTSVVRGIAWLNETLFSCGFNKELHTHVI